ncbi:glycosyltransferase [Herbaspirillum rubrisubalbicans]|uniref:glycosyltransferase n=1 Tax=Herbaspirillum rubrisubalbicans TaxID=80842 RepID=UPI001558F139|nr:glycosyltransferase [Herbaspirillum rubrisubalbicans]
MRIVIDLQGAQTESRYRGIGRYSMAISLALTRIACRTHEIHLVVNGHFHEGANAIRDSFAEYLPAERIHCFTPPLPLALRHPNNTSRARVAENMREQFISVLRPDVVLITSLFEGFVDDAVTSVGSFDKETFTAAILYDLIPLNNPGTYLNQADQAAYYYDKLESLKRCDLLLAISEYSRQEGIRMLPFDENKVVNISAAAADHFAPISLPQEELLALKQRFGISRDFILYAPGGFDARKNVDGLIAAFAKLPPAIRRTHQLVIMSRSGDTERTFINRQLLANNMLPGELVLTGYVSDEEMCQLYSAAKLCVFCSKHEGFGLPVLEAMRCGAAVIGADNTSIPEVIGRTDALFDPYSEQSISDKMAQVLAEPAWLEEMRAHGLKQARLFSWEKSARALLNALERHVPPHRPVPVAATRPRLAFVSPLPPQRTGIADYSAQLLPALAEHFDITLVSDTKEPLPPELSDYPHHDAEWFASNGRHFDRILYHVGNSPYHTYMFSLMPLHPGVVVLHDFFLSAVLGYEELHGGKTGMWRKALFHSHGYPALAIYAAKDAGEEKTQAKNLYPCNLNVLQHAKAVIVHSEYSRKLAAQFYGPDVARNWISIPLLRIAPTTRDRNGARAALGLADDDFVVCSFGFIDPTKESRSLVDAWLSSALGHDSHCVLVLVGQNHPGTYGEELAARIKEESAARVIITGWTEFATYQRYLEAADAGVQLRSMSRGETSAAVLDCMSYGLPTIVNACGSMADLPSDAVLRLPEHFTSQELVVALERLYGDAQLRAAIGDNAATLLAEKHAPQRCAELYAQGINTAFQEAETDFPALLRAIVPSLVNLTKVGSAESIFQALADNAAPQPRVRQLLVDVTAIARKDLNTGIERVVKAQLRQLFAQAGPSLRVEPIYLSVADGRVEYRYARNYTYRLLGIDLQDQLEPSLDVAPGDIFYGLDFAPGDVIAAAQNGIYSRWRAKGVELNFLVYDLLPVLLPHRFPEGADYTHAIWLQEVAKIAHRMIGISAAVTDELVIWLDSQNLVVHHPLCLSPVLLGADLDASGISNIVKPKSKAAVKGSASFRKGPSSETVNFLMVGTIEPRKGHLQTLDAFERLWREGHDISLTIIGNEGWKQLPTEQRRTIPELVARLLQHPERNKRLYWLHGADDAQLQEAYCNASCLLAASEGEGFGLPLIEAALHGLPIVARDLRVFREVAGEHAFYFAGHTSDMMASSLAEWLSLRQMGSAPSSEGLRWLTWRENAALTLQVLQGQAADRTWAPPYLADKARESHLDLIHDARVQMVSQLLPQASIILDLGGANCPLYKMSYPHAFERLTLIDLPPDQRHEYYKEITLDTGECPYPVTLRYTDMTTLEGIEDGSVDLVWSGQSLEHVPEEAGRRMCREAFRVLRKGGHFCLDTPNRLVTRIHTAPVGGGFIHPEHFIEYTPEQLRTILADAGFIVEASYGICEMPESTHTGVFHYADFMYGKQISKDVDKSYIQFHLCKKP